MNPDQILAMLAGHIGNAFNGAWGLANQATLPILRPAANILARPVGWGVGKAMGVSDNQMNQDYYNAVSQGLISDQNPIGDASSFVIPDVQGAMKGDPYAVAGFVPYAGKIARPIKAGVKAVKTGEKVVKPMLKSIKASPKGVNPAKSPLGKIAQHVDRNSGKYYTGTVGAGLVNSMYGNGGR